MWKRVSQTLSRSLPIPIPGRTKSDRDSSSSSSSKDIIQSGNDATTAMMAPSPAQGAPTILSSASPPVSHWVPDSAVTECSHCHAGFSLFLRRHHCRLCGRVFCYRCTPHRARIPSSMACITPMSPPKMLGGLLSSPNPERERRLCLGCFDSIGRQKNGYVFARVLSLAMRQWYQLDDTVMCRVACVCRMWRDVALLFRQKFHRTIRARIAADRSRPRSESEKSVLRANALLVCARHEHAIPRLAELMSSESSLQRVPPLKVERLGVTTAIHTMDSLSKVRRGKASQALYEAAHKSIIDVSNERAASLLTRLAFLSDTYTLQMFVLSHSPSVQFRMFWLLRVYQPDAAEWLVKNVSKSMNRQIAMSLGVARLLDELANTSDPVKRRQAAATWAAVNEKHSPWFPGLPGRYFLGVNTSEMSVIKSTSCPVVLPCRIQGVNGRVGVVNILYKHESVLNDAVMMDCLFVCSRALVKESETRSMEAESRSPGLLPRRKKVRQAARGGSLLVRYAVVPLSQKSGLVAMVPKSRTLHGIAQSGVSLQNYLLDRNKSSTVDRLRKQFVESAAICSVQSMLFGLGDRHLENILLTDSGLLFHVDYTYMFGREPSGKSMMVRKNQMKITPSMVDIMGGQQSSYYQLFRERTAQIGSLLRSRANLFSILCEPTLLVESSLSSRRRARARLLQHFYAAFRPGQSQEETEIQIYNLVAYNTQHRAFDAVLDRLHDACVRLF